MALRALTLDFLRDLERSSNRKLNYPDDVGYLLETARRSDQMQIFEEMIFLAKFITKSLEVMKRIGADGEGYDKLSAEFRTSLQKVSSQIRDLSSKAPDDVRQSEEARFLGLTQDNLGRLVSLMADLTLVKNWILDGKPIP